MILISSVGTGLMMRHAMTSARILLAFVFQYTATTEARARVPLPFRLSLPPEPVSVAVSLPDMVSPSAPVWPVAVRVPTPSRPNPAPLGLAARPLLSTIPEIETVLGESSTMVQARRPADAGNLDEAECAALEIADLYAPEADTFYLLGLIADVRGYHADADDLYCKAPYLEPVYYEALTHPAVLLDVADDTMVTCQLIPRTEHALARQDKRLSASSEFEAPKHIRRVHGARHP